MSVGYKIANSTSGKDVDIYVTDTLSRGSGTVGLISLVQVRLVHCEVNNYIVRWFRVVFVATNIVTIKENQ